MICCSNRASTTLISKFQNGKTYLVFSASFYLLSRYEEYLPHVKDHHGRFPPNESLAYRHVFLQSPVVDIWAYKLLEVLKDRFPEMERKSRSYSYTSVIDVNTSHAFAHRSFVRSVSGLFYDCLLYTSDAA